jgi:diacylglycerol kinase family enzyme
MEGRISTFGRLPGDASFGGGAAHPVRGEGVREFAAAPLVGLVRNPRSHRNKGRDAALAGRQDVLLAEPTTRAELEAALARFAEAGIDILAVSGGDGTVRDVLTRGAPLFADRWPAIAVLPQGKTNALALDLGVTGRTTLDHAIAAARQGRLLTRRPIIVSDHKGEARDRWGFIFGAGVFNAAIDAGQVAHRFGAFQSFAIGVTALAGMTQALFGFGRSPWRKRYRMVFTDAATGESLPHSDQTRPDRRYIAGFTTLRRFPLGMKLLAGVEDDRTIGYFMIDAPSRRALALVPAAAMGWHGPSLAGLGMHRGDGQAFDVALENGFILDGERFPAGQFRMATGPELRFVVP